MKPLTSTANPLIKSIAKLQSDSRERRATGLFCVESARELGRALAQGFEPTHVLVDDPAHIDAELHHALTLANAEVFHVTEQIIEKVAFRENPSGLLAVLRARATPLESLKLDAKSLIVICSGLEKPGNIGAILRTADAVGVTGVCIDREEFDLFNPNLIRASTGAVFHVPTACAPADAILQRLKGADIQIIALTPEATTRYTDADLRRATAIVLGAEAEGLGETWKAAADERIAIPMRGIADSLNVSVTAAVLLFEAARQRTA